MTSFEKKVHQTLWAFVIAFMITMTLIAVAVLRSPPSHADENGYYSRLNAAGYYGGADRWLNIGNAICGMTARGVSTYSMATWVVANTGDNVYRWDATNEVIPIAQQELCSILVTGPRVAA